MMVLPHDHQGVMFIAVDNDAQSVTEVWLQTLEMVGGRVYGGHVLALGGTSSECMMIRKGCSSSVGPCRVGTSSPSAAPAVSA
jgi:hypothetical protein